MGKINAAVSAVLTLAFTAVVSTVPVYAQTDVQTLVGEMYEGVFANCSFAVKACFSDGTPIASVNAARRMCPASTMKTITTATALSVLGGDYRWHTSLACSGEIDSCGTLHGDLFIIGGGDPTFAADHSPYLHKQSADRLFGAMASMLREAGIVAVDGGVCGDGSYFEGMREDPTWLYEDIGTYYGTCVSGLNFYENRKDLLIQGGQVEGAPLSVTDGFPATPWMRWIYNCATGKPGTGDKLFVFSSELTSKAVLYGTFGAGKGTKTVHFRNNFPEFTAANELRQYLISNGIPVTGKTLQLGCQGPLDECDSLSWVLRALPEVTVLGSVPSLSLAEVVCKTNQESDNFYAEVLLRTLGKYRTGHSDLDSSAEQLKKELEAAGFHLGREVTIHDGSGLSIRDRVTAGFMCDFLRDVYFRKDFETFRRSLVKYGQRCFLKTGSMTGCRCLCGYIMPHLPGHNAIIFSIMVNDSEKTVYELDRQQKKIIDALSLLN